VLRLIAQIVAAARDVSIPVEVCGDSAGEEEMVPLLVGLGVSELSVAPRRIDLVRWAVRSINAQDAETVAARALEGRNAEDALALAGALLPSEIGNKPHEVRNRFGGVAS
jgi:phosphoenolpyruvate-protein kinase (PTS system EI component)